jgi:hypothetical protein
MRLMCTPNEYCTCTTRLLLSEFYFSMSFYDRDIRCCCVRKRFMIKRRIIL